MDPVHFSAFLKIYFDIAEIYRGSWLEESGRRIVSIDRTHLVLTSGKPVLQKDTFLSGVPRQPWPASPASSARTSRPSWSRSSSPRSPTRCRPCLSNFWSVATFSRRRRRHRKETSHQVLSLSFLEPYLLWRKGVRLPDLKINLVHFRRLRETTSAGPISKPVNLWSILSLLVMSSTDRTFNGQAFKDFWNLVKIILKEWRLGWHSLKQCLKSSV